MTIHRQKKLRSISAESHNKTTVESYSSMAGQFSQDLTIGGDNLHSQRHLARGAGKAREAGIEAANASLNPIEHSLVDLGPPDQKC